MLIRHATPTDIPALIEVDREAYGETGASREYFTKKFSSFAQGIFVVQEQEKVVGFIVVEVYGNNDVPVDFCNLNVRSILPLKWMFIAAFTTATNYKERGDDTKLLEAAELLGKKQGCIAVYVPLPPDHPFEGNGVFEFWRANEYRPVGSIQWIAPTEKLIGCDLFMKKL
ncbi:hypothetical protein HYV86_03550 [Candidatus Woesearchaeota archaeon]|nr:hypothetical protein [Candidatus Woesearchaeota archaeon]